MTAKESKRHLVEQVASSHYLAKSARLREMFTYVCDRVLEHSAAEIHEQEVGHHVFGRPADYDTTDDNTVRVHASMLRKRIEQYFATEGSSEPVIIEIPRGNYAPRFRERPVMPVVPPPELQPGLASPIGLNDNDQSIMPRSHAKWKVWIPSILAALFAGLSFFLFFNTRGTHSTAAALKGQPTVRLFWSQFLPVGKRLDIVISDASLGTFQEITNQPITLSEYFDRSYMNKIEERATAAKMDPAFAASLVLKRESNYSEIALLPKIEEIAKALRSDTTVQFARDYSFRQLKTDNAVLLGYPTSDPWIEPFESYLTLRWKYDPVRTHYVVDTTATGKQKSGTALAANQVHESYATLSFVPNLSNTGNILILSGTGGAASGAALDFLSDEHSMIQLHDLLTHDKKAPFPHFEALLKVVGHNSVPRNSSIVLCRRLKP